MAAIRFLQLINAAERVSETDARTFPAPPVSARFFGNQLTVHVNATVMQWFCAPNYDCKFFQHAFIGRSLIAALPLLANTVFSPVTSSVTHPYVSSRRHPDTFFRFS